MLINPNLNKSNERIRRPRIPQKIPYYVVKQIMPVGVHADISEYLQGCGVFELAKSFLSDVYYYAVDEKGKRKYFLAAGWQNDNKGWEIRTAVFKSCIGFQAITCIPRHSKKAIIFENFIDFLSWKLEHPTDDASIIVLNSPKMLEQAINKAKLFPSIDIYFERNKSGKQATIDLIKALPYATDKSGAYKHFNCYNDKIKSQLPEVTFKNQAKHHGHSPRTSF